MSDLAYLRACEKYKARFVPIICHLTYTAANASRTLESFGVSRSRAPAAGDRETPYERLFGARKPTKSVSAGSESQQQVSAQAEPILVVDQERFALGK